MKDTKPTEKTEDEISVAEEESPNGIYLACKDSEILRCFSLMSELRSHLKEESFLAQIKEQIEEGYHLFYFSIGNEIVALAGCTISTNLAWGRHLYIDDLISSQDKRSYGYGKEIIAYLSDFAREQGCEEIHLDSGVQRFGAHKFYLREGFFISSHHFTYKIEM